MGVEPGTWPFRLDDHESWCWISGEKSGYTCIPFLIPWIRFRLPPREGDSTLGNCLGEGYRHIISRSAKVRHHCSVSNWKSKCAILPCLQRIYSPKIVTSNLTHFGRAPEDYKFRNHMKILVINFAILVMNWIWRAQNLSKKKTILKLIDYSAGSLLALSRYPISLKICH